jgi:hypothetical protein
MSEKPNKTSNKDDEYIKEIASLKSKISYSIGSLETINYLIKNDNPEMIQKNMEHLRSIVTRVLNDLNK